MRDYPASGALYILTGLIALSKTPTGLKGFKAFIKMWPLTLTIYLYW